MGQFRYISGHEDVVDQVCAGLEVLSTHQMGRHKTAAVRGSGVKLQDAPQGRCRCVPHEPSERVCGPVRTWGTPSEEGHQC